MPSVVSMTDPTNRFTDRVQNYVRYRPGYPPAVVSWLTAECGLTADAVVADIGSGTGLLAKLFLENGNRVFGVEPNQAMREAGEELLRPFVRFVSVAARAEMTTLPPASVDFVTAGQAFHWFDYAVVAQEFRRIVRPGGWVVLIWNERLVDATPFLADYERLLLTYGTDYAQVDHRRVRPDLLRQLFGEDMRRAQFENQQVFDYAALEGRLLSSSYAPLAGQPGYAPMLTELRALFDAHQVDGHVVFLYRTEATGFRL